MAFAYRTADGWAEIEGPFTLGEGEGALQYPGDWPWRATPDERAEAGIFEIVETDRPPASLRTVGSTLIGDEVPERAWVTTPYNLDQLRAQMLERVNAEAGEFRRRFITDIPGQQATYLAKEQEAAAWTPSSDPAGFPYLVNEAAATGVSVADIAALVLQTASAWRALDPKIEGRRRGAAVAIAAAADAEAIMAAAAVNWESLLA